MTNSGENGDLVRVRPPRVESSADGVKPGAEGQLAATRMNGGMALHEVHSSRVRCRCGAHLSRGLFLRRQIRRDFRGRGGEASAHDELAARRYQLEARS
jgi:hypothetical protein